MTKKNEVAIKEEKNTALATLSEVDQFMLDNAGDGMDDYGSDDLVIPFLRIIQALSPEIDKNDPKFIPGAEKGDIFNTATGKVYPKTFIVIPCVFQKVYLEWTPRAKGGGLVANLGNDPVCLEGTSRDPNTGRDVNEAGNEIVQTNNHYVIVVDEETGEMEQGVISMSSSALRISKGWNSKVASVTAKHPQTGKVIPMPPYFYSYSVKSVNQRNDKGNWETWQIEQDKKLQEMKGGYDFGAAAKNFREIILSGKTKLQETSQDPIVVSNADDVL